MSSLNMRACCVVFSKDSFTKFVWIATTSSTPRALRKSGFFRQVQVGEDRRIPLRGDHHAKLPVEFGREVARIARHDDVACRIMAEQPSDIGDRDADRFERTR